MALAMLDQPTLLSKALPTLLLRALAIIAELSSVSWLPTLALPSASLDLKMAPHPSRARAAEATGQKSDAN